MKILIATLHRGVVGGVETYLRSVLPALQDRNHELALVTDFPAAAPAIDDDCSGLPVWDMSRLDAALAWRPDICYFNGIADQNAEQAILATVPTVAFAHGYAGLCVSGTRFHKSTGRPCTRRLGPGCLAVYLPLGCGGKNPLTMLSRYRRNVDHRQGLCHAHAVLAASHSVAAELVRAGVPAGRVHRTPLFVPGAVPDLDPPVSRVSIGQILFVGRLVAEKGWRQLLTAMPIAEATLGRRVRLNVAGDGPDAAAFRAAAAGSNVHFLGFVDHKTKVAAMRAADVLVVPSVWPEPFGLVGIEAGCVGLPAVGFAAGGIPDWLIPGVTGELAPADPPTAAGLAAALVRILGDDTHRHRLAVGAWQKSHEFGRDAHVDQLLGHLSSAALTGVRPRGG